MSYSLKTALAFVFMVIFALFSFGKTVDTPRAKPLPRVESARYEIQNHITGQTSVQTWLRVGGTTFVYSHQNQEEVPVYKIETNADESEVTIDNGHSDVLLIRKIPTPKKMLPLGVSVSGKVIVIDKASEKVIITYPLWVTATHVGSRSVFTYVTKILDMQETSVAETYEENSLLPKRIVHTHAIGGKYSLRVTTTKTVSGD